MQLVFSIHGERQSAAWVWTPSGSKPLVPAGTHLALSRTHTSPLLASGCGKRLILAAPTSASSAPRSAPSPTWRAWRPPPGAVTPPAAPPAVDVPVSLAPPLLPPGTGARPTPAHAVP